jgi:hypothetical protein
MNLYGGQVRGLFSAVLWIWNRIYFGRLDPDPYLGGHLPTKV